MPVSRLLSEPLSSLGRLFCQASISPWIRLVLQYAHYYHRLCQPPSAPGEEDILIMAESMTSLSGNTRADYYCDADPLNAL